MQLYHFNCDLQTKELELKKEANALACREATRRSVARLTKYAQTYLQCSFTDTTTHLVR